MNTRRVELSAVRTTPNGTTYALSYLETVILRAADDEDTVAGYIEEVMEAPGFPEEDLIPFAARAYFHRQNAIRIREAFMLPVEA